MPPSQPDIAANGQAHSEMPPPLTGHPSEGDIYAWMKWEDFLRYNIQHGKHGPDSADFVKGRVFVHRLIGKWAGFIDKPEGDELYVSKAALVEPQFSNTIRPLVEHACEHAHGDILSKMDAMLKKHIDEAVARGTAAVKEELRKAKMERQDELREVRVEIMREVTSAKNQSERAMAELNKGVKTLIGGTAELAKAYNAKAHDGLATPYCIVYSTSGKHPVHDMKFLPLHNVDDMKALNNEELEAYLVFYGTTLRGGTRAQRPTQAPLSRHDQLVELASKIGCKHLSSLV